MSEPEVFEVLRKIRYDLTAAQGKITTALNLLADMDLPGVDEEDGEWKCGCGRRFKTERSLALHKHNVHGGPAVPLSELEQAG